MIGDKIALEILSNRFQAIVDEMAQALFRTAYTVFIKETQDYGAVLVSPQGEVFAASRRYGVLMMVGMPMASVVVFRNLLRVVAGFMTVSFKPRYRRTSG